MHILLVVNCILFLLFGLIWSKADLWNLFYKIIFLTAFLGNIFYTLQIFGYLVKS